MLRRTESRIADISIYALAMDAELIDCHQRT